jgi:hypothetical protein
MRNMGHIPHIGDVKHVYRILVGKSQWKKPLGIDGRVILKWILKK